MKYEDLTGRQKTRVNRYFDEQIFPILTPQAVDAGRPFPMISNTSINIVAELEAVAASAPVKVRFARVKCPNNLPRFLFLTDADKEGSETFAVTEDTNQVLLVEDLIVRRMGQLFPGYKVKIPVFSASPATPTVKSKKTKPMTCCRPCATTSSSDVSARS